MQLRNLVSKQLLKQRLSEETFNRKTVSYYRYFNIEDVENFRNQLYIDFEALNIFGRIYVAAEGINAQISVPEHN